MAVINSTIAKRERFKLKLSLEELSKRAGVDKATLHRIEGGRMKRNAEHVVTRLAKIFGMEADQLTSATAEAAEAVEDGPFSYRSQLNVRLSHESRNALALVSKRYAVKPLEIIEFAPLLFHLVAAETLAERAARLERLRAARREVESLGNAFPHIAERLVNDWTGEDLDRREERSIRARDLRGDLLDEGADFVDARPLEYDSSVQNPFMQIVGKRLAAIQAEGGARDALEHWSHGAGPRYEICRDEALELVGGDAEACEAIIEGRVAIHELPKELRAGGQVEARVRWVKERAAELAARDAQWLETHGFGGLEL